MYPENPEGTGVSVRIDGGLGVEPPTSTFKTHYFS